MTIHERVREAGDAKAREVGHKAPSVDADTTSGGVDKAAMYARLLDPSSDWPEPALKGEHLKQVMDRLSPPTATSTPPETREAASLTRNSERHIRSALCCTAHACDIHAYE
ncbi:hypothetical protein VOLCADRAFT_90507 [Volvox carteri f. nagariensis]|uniref:Uncharacterized protein n=1 Tax=Volvox carteri f. nagariensis TaxID=3068 RepID=D8TUK3_VOLCA|nr:uncharacterized protein VOLCADRAFT_90507 [Volvox carteri f. nagariensis]EFJ48723.1 hypothetical protein VOLCADRAFT_90507 [Volvox carteri f. nagariensis]|eukprot:XP_002950055.1 hypothetical protein VOLCADRAFT_90507 [Volvox carteri f. nagariensis]